MKLTGEEISKFSKALPTTMSPECNVLGFSNPLHSKLRSYRLLIAKNTLRVVTVYSVAL